MIYYTDDIHGSAKGIVAFAQHYELTESDIIVILGEEQSPPSSVFTETMNGVQTLSRAISRKNGMVALCGTRMSIRTYSSPGTETSSLWKGPGIWSSVALIA